MLPPLLLKLFQTLQLTLFYLPFLLRVSFAQKLITIATKQRPFPYTNSPSVTFLQARIIIKSYYGKWSTNRKLRVEIPANKRQCTCDRVGWLLCHCDLIIELLVDKLNIVLILWVSYCNQINLKDLTKRKENAQRHWYIKNKKSDTLLIK